MTWLTDKAQLVHLVIPWKEKAYFSEAPELTKKPSKDSWEKVFFFYLQRMDSVATPIASSSRLFD